MGVAPQKGVAVTIRPTLLGVGVAFAAFLSLAHSTSPLIQQESNGWLIVIGCLVGIVLLAGIILIVRQSLLSVLQTKQYYMLTVLSSLSFAMMLAALFLHTIAPMLSGILAGAGFLLLMTIWCAFYAELTPEESLFNAALALGLSGILYFVCTLPVISAAPFIYATVLFLLSIVMQNASYKDFSKREKSKLALTNSLDYAEKESSLQRGKDIVRTLWKPLISAMIAAFITGLVHNPDISKSGDNFALVSSPLVSLGAPLLAAGLTLIAFFIWKKAFTLHVFCNVVMPLAVAILLIIPMVNTDVNWLRVALTLLSQGSFAIIALATWTALAGSVRTSGSTTLTIFAGACIFLALAMLTGIVLVHYIGEGGQILSLILLTVFLLLMVVDFALSDKSRNVKREVQKDIFEQFLGSRCESLAEDYKLTERESEILTYLARGYSHVYVAKELYVSENTIRTHVKHIYTKLEVSSREDLIRLIDSLE